MRAELQRQILLQALSDVPFDGFTDAVVKRASEKFGVSDDEMKATFPNGPASLVENFSEMCDGEIARAMAGSNITSVRQKVTRAMRARLEAMAPHKHAARKAASFLMRPQHAALGARLLARTADAIWREVGDRSTDFNFYSKRAIASGVYGATFVYWLSDSSEGSEKTWAFLDKRIADVMRFEKAKAQARGAAKFVPDPVKILAALRGVVRLR